MPIESEYELVKHREPQDEQDLEEKAAPSYTNDLLMTGTGDGFPSADGSDHMDVYLQSRAIRGGWQPCLLTKIMVVSTWLIFVIFVFGTPYWSYLFNDVLGYYKFTCKTPAEEIVCSNKANFVELAKARHRVLEVNGEEILVGCGCGEGVFGENLCPVVTTDHDGFTVGLEGYSLSYFIGPGPGTGALAAVSVWPITFDWWYGTGNLLALQSAGYRMPYSLVAVGLFIGAMLVYWGGIARISMKLDSDRRTPKWIAGIATFGLLAFLGGYIGEVQYMTTKVGPPDYINHSNLDGYGFWLGECLGLSAGFAMTPFLVLFA